MDKSTQGTDQSPQSRPPKPALSSRPTSLEWETIRTTFEDLYAVQKPPLKAVKDILKRDHHFHASERMYKTRIHSWHLSKKHKKNEMLAVLRKSKLRKSQGKRPLFFIRGKPIRLDEVYRYFGRKGVKSIESVDISVENTSTPKDLKCITPRDTSDEISAVNESNHMEEQAIVLHRRLADLSSKQSACEIIQSLTPIPTDIPPLPRERSLNSFLRSIEIYYSAMFPTRKWILGTVDCDIPELYPSMKFGSLFLEYHNLLTTKNYDQSFSVLEIAFGMVRMLLEVQDPRLLLYLLESIAYARSVGYHELVNQLIPFFATMARNILGVHHPITYFATGLWHGGGDESNVVELGLDCMIDQFSVHIGPWHHETMRLLLTSATILKHQGKYYAAIKHLNQLLFQYDLVYGEVSYQTCHALIDKAYLKIILEEYGEAKALVEVAMQRVEGIIDVNEKVESKVRCLVCHARLRKAQGDIEGMRNDFKTAEGIGKMELDDNHWMMKDLRASLE